MHRLSLLLRTTKSGAGPFRPCCTPSDQTWLSESPSAQWYWLTGPSLDPFPYPGTSAHIPVAAFFSRTSLTPPNPPFAAPAAAACFAAPPGPAFFSLAFFGFAEADGDGVTVGE